MELELTAPADSVAGLGRLKALSVNRDGRPRTQSVKIVWHDSPEHALLADGLSLLEQRGAWRLERMSPGEDTWLPGQPAPVLSDAPDLSALPSPLAPLAAFDGRRTASVHRFGDDPVTLTIERGTLRAVTAEHQVARILLSGEAAGVRRWRLWRRKLSVWRPGGPRRPATLVRHPCRRHWSMCRRPWRTLSGI
jgi:hypothetical protein